jgi:tellurium resistance protein TerD
MSVNLIKGQKVDLTKGNASLTKVTVGLGWDPVKKKGFFGFGGNVDIDIDASVILLDNNGKLTRKENVVYFGNLNSYCGSVHHTGDNLTGDGDGDDEQIIIDLTKLPQNIHRIIVVVNIYQANSKQQHFGLIESAFVRLFDSKTNKELVKFNLTDNYSGKTALVTGELYRYQSDWKFAAIGEGKTANSVSELANQYI